jgi:hypothetical protein
MTTRTKRIVAVIGLVIGILLCICIFASTITNTVTNLTRKQNVYSVDLQTVVEIHYKHIEKGGKPISDMVAVYEAKTDGIIIYTVQTSDGEIVDRVAFELEELWEALK